MPMKTRGRPPKNTGPPRYVNRLRELRQRLGLSQQEVAVQAGISAAYYGALERGDKRINADTAQRLHAPLRCGISDLLAGTRGVSVPLRFAIAAAGKALLTHVRQTIEEGARRNDDRVAANRPTVNEDDAADATLLDYKGCHLGLLDRQHLGRQNQERLHLRVYADRRYSVGWVHRYSKPAGAEPERRPRILL